LEGLAGERPNELLASMANTMRLVCLAEAQAATARRAEEKGTALPLLCKLHLAWGSLCSSTSNRPMLNRQTESARLYEYSP
jgi:hypothetical protein